MSKPRPAPRPDRDTRPVVKPARVASMLVAASSAAMADFQATSTLNAHPRFPLPAAWAAVRCAVHSLSDDERRAVVLQLLGEEAGRIAHELGAALSARTA